MGHYFLDIWYILTLGKYVQKNHIAVSMRKSSIETKNLHDELEWAEVMTKNWTAELLKMFTFRVTFGEKRFLLRGISLLPVNWNTAYENLLIKLHAANKSFKL